MDSVPGWKPCLMASLMESYSLTRIKLMFLKENLLKYFILIRQEK